MTNDQQVIWQEGVEPPLQIPAPDPAKFGAGKDGKILSLGEGYGALLKHAVKSEIPFTAVDLDYPKDQLAIEKSPHALLHAKARLISGSAADLPKDLTGTQDLVVAHALLENIDDAGTRRRVIQEGFRALKKNGQLRTTIMTKEMIDRYIRADAEKKISPEEYKGLYLQHAKDLVSRLPRGAYRAVLKFGKSKADGGSCQHDFLNDENSWAVGTAVLIIEKISDAPKDPSAVSPHKNPHSAGDF